MRTFISPCLALALAFFARAFHARAFLARAFHARAFLARAFLARAFSFPVAAVVRVVWSRALRREGQGGQGRDT